jgi:hypothetical protein
VAVNPSGNVTDSDRKVAVIDTVTNTAIEIISHGRVMAAFR